MSRKLCQAHDGGTALNTKVVPRSSRAGVMGVYDGVLKIKVTAPPVDGRANAECCAVVARHLGIPKSRVAVLRGASSRSKVLFLRGVSEQALRELLRKADA